MTDQEIVIAGVHGLVHLDSYEQVGAWMVVLNLLPCGRDEQA